MTKIRVLLLSALAIVFGTTWVCFGEAKSVLTPGKFLSLEEAKKKWGQKPFSVEAFKVGTAKERAPMVYDLIKSKTFVGKTAGEVKSLLGPTSGYFWSERIPTYFVDEGWAEKKDSWQLVFLTDENGRVKEVRVHKNCCD